MSVVVVPPGVDLSLFKLSETVIPAFILIKAGITVSSLLF